MQEFSSIISNPKPTHKGKRRFTKKYLMTLAVGGVLVVGIIGFGAYHLWSKSSVSNNDICSPQLIKKATPLLAPEKLQELQPVAEEILAKPNYASDVNCVYIVTTYSINLGDAAGVKKHYEQLVKVYDPEVGYSPEFGDGTITPENVKQVLGFLESIDKQLQDNQIQGPEV